MIPSQNKRASIFYLIKVIMRCLILAGSIFVAICLIAIPFTTFVPPSHQTITAMVDIQKVVFVYIARYGNAPLTLEALKRIDMSMNIADVWGREILYHIDGNSIILTSYGQDGKPGGVGQDEDVSCIFKIKNPQGGWLKEIDMPEFQSNGKKW